MNRRRNAVIQLSVLAALGAAVVLSLVLPELPGGAEAAQPLEISVLIRETDSALWGNARLGMEQAAGDLGAELRFLTLSRTNDAAEQAALLLREAEGGADAVVVVPAKADRLEPAGWTLPVVSLESDLPEARMTVSPDNAAVGRALADALVSDSRRPAAVLLLDTAPGTGVADRLAAAEETLSAAGFPTARQTLEVEDLPGRLAELMRQTGAERVMAFEPAATELAAEVRDSAGADWPLYGVGVTAEIAASLERGAVTAVTAWSDYAAGYLAVEGAVQAVRGGAVQSGQLNFSLVRGEDIYDPDNQKLLFPVTS